MLKKMLMILGIIALFLGFGFKGEVLAGDEYCTAGCIGCFVGGSFCKKTGFNCDGPLNISRKECEDGGRCYESITTSGSLLGQDLCYSPKGEDPTPNTCGYIGRTCCDGNPCPNSGIPTTNVVGICTCTESGSEDGIPSHASYNPFCPDGVKINTALGCVPVKMEEFVPWLLTWLFGVAGGIAFLLMSYGFILVATSGGDEKKVQGAKETITSAVVGLLVCIFAIFILRLIAINILQIPGI